MKKHLFLLMMLVVFFSVVIYTQASTEEERYWDYVVAELENLQQGGVFSGNLFEIDQKESASLSFAEYFVGGVARATINCKVGWYQGYASWENMDREQIFCSEYIAPTYLGAGLQSIPFMMTVNHSRSVKFVINGKPVTDQDEIWFNGVRAWRDNGNTWRAWVYKPWNVIGQNVEVIWLGHGGWNLNFGVNSFSENIILQTVDIDTSMISPTQLQVFSFLSDGAYLKEELVSYWGRYYDPGLSCDVLELESFFTSNIKEFTMILNGYQEYPNSMVNYFTVTVKNVSPGVFIIPLGNTWIRPYTNIKIFLTDPETGDYRWKYLDVRDLWYESQNRGDKG